MNESERLADQLTKALNGDAWHGPSWSEALEGITREGALHRPITEAHSIAEIVLHATTWNDLVRRRLLGELPEVTETELVLAAMRITDDEIPRRDQRRLDEGVAVQFHEEILRGGLLMRAEAATARHHPTLSAN